MIIDRIKEANEAYKSAAVEDEQQFNRDFLLSLDGAEATPQEYKVLKRAFPNFRFSFLLDIQLTEEGKLSVKEVNTVYLNTRTGEAKVYKPYDSFAGEEDTCIEFDRRLIDGATWKDFV